jgi:hypothetical protein
VVVLFHVKTAGAPEARGCAAKITRPATSK